MPEAIKIDAAAGTMRVGARTFKQGDVITIDGATGRVFAGAVPMRQPELSGDFALLTQWADGARRLKVRANADTPRDARQARAFGAEGIGLARTEHMFFDAERILAMREMICASDEAGRRAALAKILPMQRADFVELFEIMEELPVTIRLLDPPLHEFLPRHEREIEGVAEALKIPVERLKGRIAELVRVQSDARLPRLPARDPLSRDHRDAGARHLRGGGRRRQEGRAVRSSPRS